MPRSLLSAAIQDFKPKPTRPTVVWFHQTNGDEHYVGLAKEIHLELKDLHIRFDWLVRVEHGKNGHQTEWRPIMYSKKSGNAMTFTGVTLKEVHVDQLELQEGHDIVDLCTGEDRVTEAQEILSRY